MDEFVAIDFETANSRPESACAVGLVRFRGDQVVGQEYSLISPRREYTKFEQVNIGLHGITKTDVAGAPRFTQIWKTVLEITENFQLPVVCHNQSADMRVLYALAKLHKLSYSEIQFLDSLSVAKKVWQRKSHDLSILAESLGFSFNHHRADEDAEICGRITIALMKQTQTRDLAGLASSCGLELGRVTNDGITKMNGESASELKSSPKQGTKASSKNFTPSRAVDRSNLLFGKKIVTTGSFLHIGDELLTQAIADLGAEKLTDVSGKTDFLVIGQKSFNANEETGKLKRANAFNAKGKKIQILNESEFLQYLEKAKN